MNIIFDNLEKLIALGILLTSSLYLRFLLQLLGQSWIKTTAHTATLMLLPILTYVITSVISGNIALSLGMVGALSIIRFRNPVRSPLELSVYFGTITMGIAAAVSTIWLGFLMGSISLVALTLMLSNFVSIKVFDKPFFTTSFSEGSQLSTLVVESNDIVNALHESEYLFAVTTHGSLREYLLTAHDFKVLLRLDAALEGNLAINKRTLSK